MTALESDQLIAGIEAAEAGPRRGSGAEADEWERHGRVLRGLGRRGGRQVFGLGERSHRHVPPESDRAGNRAAREGRGASPHSRL
jgi:hypothetical protein